MSGRMTSTPHLLLKGPKDRVVVEGAALDHDVPAQLLGTEDARITL